MRPKSPKSLRLTSSRRTPSIPFPIARLSRISKRNTIIWFFTNRSSDADDDGDKHIVVAENLFFRSSPSAITDNNLINRLSYGTELKLLGREGDWAEVEVEGEHGYVGWRYILPDSPAPPTGRFTTPTKKAKCQTMSHGPI